MFDLPRPLLSVEVHGKEKEREKEMEKVREKEKMSEVLALLATA